MKEQRNVTKTLNEDLSVLKLDPAMQARLAGVDGSKMGVRTASWRRPSNLQEDKAPEQKRDPIDGPVVTKSLCRRIMKLNFKKMTENDCHKLLVGLKKKRIPKNESLRKMATKVVKMIIEARTAAKRGKKIVRMTESKKGKNRVVKKFRKVTESKKTPTKKTMTKKSLRESKSSALAKELRNLLHEETIGDQGARSETMERMNRVFGLIGKEMKDKEVRNVLGEAFSPIQKKWNKGLMTEGRMDEEKFLASLRPALSVMVRALDKIDRGQEDLVKNLRALSA